MHDGMQTIHDLPVVHLDGELAAAVEAPRREIDGTDDGPDSVGEKQLGMELKPFQPVHLDADIVQDSQAPDTLDEFLLLQLVRWPGQDVHSYAAMICPHQAFNDHGVLVALVLHPQRMFCLVDELANSLSAIPNAPDQMRLLARREGGAVPIGLEALDDLRNLVTVLGHDRVVARFGEILSLPIERHDERCFVINYH